MNITPKKIIILVPAQTARGGITNYYQVIKKEFSGNIVYFERGARTWPIRKGFIAELIRARTDYINFKNRLKKRDISLVQTSTSLGLYTTIRDGLFLRYARKNGIKTIVFFRGWDLKEEKRAIKHIWLLKYFFFSSNCIITLTEHSKQCIKSWGYKGDIFIETTLVDKDMIKDVSIELLKEKNMRFKETNVINLLFLSRVEKSKGVYELIEVFKKIKKQHSRYNFKLNICGDGFELEYLKKEINEEKISDVNFFGFVENQQKIRAYETAHIFIFPSYSEGMPNAVLEAMGFGLPIITTPVGGVRDFFESGKNGYFVEIKNIFDIEDKIMQLICNTSNMLTMSLNNFEKANQLFRSDIVAKRIEAIFEKVIKTNY